MPVIRDIASACQHYGIPYPMTRKALCNLLTAVMRTHEDAECVCTKQGATCSGCWAYVSDKEFCRRWHKYNQPFTPHCEKWEPAQTTYVLEMQSSDVNFDLEARYGNRHQDTAPQHSRTEA